MSVTQLARPNVSLLSVRSLRAGSFLDESLFVIV